MSDQQFNFPPLNQCPDELKRVTGIRLAMQKEVDAVEAYEKALKRHLIDTIPKDSAGVFGLQYKAKVITKPTIRVSQDGWPALLNWVRQTGRFDILQKRVNAAPLLELWDGGESANGVAIPGTERAVDVDLSLTKV